MVGINTAASQTLTVKVTEPDKVKITKVSADEGKFEVKLTDGDPAGNATYEVHFEGTDKLGRMSGRVRVEFTGGAVPHVDVPVRGQVVGDLSYPQSITFNRRQGSFGERDLTFTSRAKKDVEILGAEDPDKNLMVEVTEAKGKTAKIHVKVAKPEADSNKPVRGKLVIRTTDPDEPEVTIAYGVYYQRGRMERPGAASPARLPPSRRGLNVRDLKPPALPR